VIPEDEHKYCRWFLYSFLVRAKLFQDYKRIEAWKRPPIYQLHCVCIGEDFTVTSFPEEALFLSPHGGVMDNAVALAVEQHGEAERRFTSSRWVMALHCGGEGFDPADGTNGFSW
jgi:hypothetical protein